MPTFNYKAKDRSGNTVTGAIEAPDEHGAAAMIREMGHLPMDIRPARGSSSSASDEAGSLFTRHLIYPLWTGINIKMLALFYRQMATLLSSGMTLSEALGSVGNRSGGVLRRIILEAQDKVRAGGTLSSVFARYPRIFSNLQISLLRAGETGGMIETMLDRIASYLEYEIKVRQLIAKALFYPILVFVFIMLITSALPYLPSLLKEPNGVQIVLRGTWSTLRYWVFGGLAAVVTLKLVFQFELPRLMWDAVKLAVPVVGGTARRIAMSRFSRAMAVLYAAGLPAGEAIRVAADACANIYLSRKLKYAAPSVEAGKGLTESLAKTKAVMPMVMDMLATGEKTGNMDAVLQKVADYMDDEADATIHKLGIAVFVLAILIAAVIVLMILVKFYSEYASGMLETVE